MKKIPLVVPKCIMWRYFFKVAKMFFKSANQRMNKLDKETERFTERGI